MPSRFPVFLAIAVLISAPFCNGATTSRAADRHHLMHRLKHLPRNASSYHSVSFCVIRLVRLDPKHAAKYYKLGLTRLDGSSPSRYVDARKYMLAVVKVLKHSDLTSEQLKKFIKQVTPTYAGPWNTPPTPTLTPTPTPAP